MTIEISNCSLVCNKGSGKFNEDVVGLSSSGAWVLDGATGLNNKNLVSSQTDAKWYVNWWNKYLYKNISKKDSLENIIKNGIEEVSKEYVKKLGSRKVHSLDLPSCSCAILKFHNDKIEYLVLGDCTLFIKDKENITTVTDDTISKFDKIVYDAMNKLEVSKTLNINEKKSKVMPILIENRLKKNVENGYWILEFSKEAIDKSIKGFINMEDKIDLMLTSDGISCGIDKYKLFKEEDMTELAKNKGVGYILREIRDLEEKDKNGVKFNRFKISDDASCMYLEIYKNKDNKDR